MRSACVCVAGKSAIFPPQRDTTAAFDHQKIAKGVSLPSDALTGPHQCRRLMESGEPPWNTDPLSVYFALSFSSFCHCFIFFPPLSTLHSFIRPKVQPYIYTIHICASFVRWLKTCGVLMEASPPQDTLIV